MGGNNTGLKVFLGFIAFLIVCLVIYLVVKELNKPATELSVQVLGSTSSTGSGAESAAQITVGRGFIALGDVLKQGLPAALYSKNNIYMLVLLNNGELQFRKGGLTLWRTNIYSPVDLKNCTARMESVGIVIRDQNDRLIWQMLTKEYVQALGLDVQQLILTNDGQVLLADKAGKTQYKLNLFRLPALGPKSKIDDQYHLGSLINDFCVCLGTSGYVIHATCHPKNKTKSIYYADKLIFGSSADGGNVGAFTSVELTSEKVLVAKAQGKPDWTIAIGSAIITINPAGDILTFIGWEEYMNRQPGLSQMASELIGNSIQFDTTVAPDFMVITAPYIIKAPANPYYMHIAETGQVRIQLQHIDQGLDKQAKLYNGISGFKSAGSQVVLVFGPVYNERGPLTETLNSMHICLIDPRQYDLRDAGLDYVTVFDPIGVIKNQPPLGTNEFSIIYTLNKANKMSRVVRVQTFDLVQMAQVLSVDESGSIQCKDAVSGKVVGPIERIQ